MGGAKRHNDRKKGPSKKLGKQAKRAAEVQRVLQGRHR